MEEVFHHDKDDDDTPGAASSYQQDKDYDDPVFDGGGKLGPSESICAAGKDCILKHQPLKKERVCLNCEKNIFMVLFMVIFGTRWPPIVRCQSNTSPKEGRRY